MTHIVQSTRDDIDSLSSQVSSLTESVNDQDTRDELEKLQQSLTRIERKF